MSHRIKNFILEFRHRLKEIYYSLKYLSLASNWREMDPSERQSGIAMIDGRVRHGGTFERFKGMISLFNYCRYVGKPFRIRHNYPFELTDYLEPNQYDWKISDKDISNSIWHVRPVYTKKEDGIRLSKLKTNKQIRFYGNRDFAVTLPFPPFNDNWGETFNFLFKPTRLLQEQIDSHKQAIGDDYVAAVFRFQNLLGDFQEYHFKAISNLDYKKRLLDACIEQLIEIYGKNDGLKILVTSDSNIFLERASELDFVYAIKGKQSHIDTKNTNQSNTIKPFIDLYMIAGAKKVYGISIDEMYNSDFPVRAAMIGQIPFIRIEKKLSIK